MNVKIVTAAMKNDQDALKILLPYLRLLKDFKAYYQKWFDKNRNDPKSILFQYLKILSGERDNTMSPTAAQGNKKLSKDARNMINNVIFSSVIIYYWAKLEDIIIDIVKLQNLTTRSLIVFDIFKYLLAFTIFAISIYIFNKYICQWHDEKTALFVQNLSFECFKDVEFMFGFYTRDHNKLVSENFNLTESIEININNDPLEQIKDSQANSNLYFSDFIALLTNGQQQGWIY